jgi:hypothetical protein
MAQYRLVLGHVVEGTDILERLHVEPDELEDDYRSLIARYVALSAPEMRGFFRRIAAGMLDPANQEDPELYRSNEMGHVFTMAPVDVFNLVYEYMKVVGETKVPSLVADMLVVAEGALVEYQSRLTRAVRRLGPRTNEKFAAALANDCFTCMEELDALQTAHKAVMESESVDFRRATRAFIEGGLVATSCLLDSAFAGAVNMAFRDVFAEASAGRLDAGPRSAVPRSAVRDPLAATDAGGSSPRGSGPTRETQSAGSGDGDGDGGHMTLICETLHERFAEYQRWLCDYFFKKMLVMAVQRIVVGYLRALYAPTMSVFKPFSLLPAETRKIRDDADRLRSVITVFVPADNRFFKKRIASKLKVLRTTFVFLSEAPNEALAAYKSLVSKRPLAAPSIFTLFTLCLTVRKDVQKSVRRKTLKKADTILRAALKDAEEGLATPEGEAPEGGAAPAARSPEERAAEATARREADIYFQVFPVTEKELRERRSLGSQMPHFRFMEQTKLEQEGERAEVEAKADAAEERAAKEAAWAEESAHGRGFGPVDRAGYRRKKVQEKHAGGMQRGVRKRT